MVAEEKYHKTIIKHESTVAKYNDVCKIRHEVNILSALHCHGGIVNLKAFDVSHAEIGMILTPKAHCDAFELVKSYRLPRDTKVAFIKFILPTVAFLHRMGLHHGQVKLEHILVYGDSLFKLCDFQQSGYERIMNLQQLARNSPTPYYAPEAFTGDIDMFQQDVWATGMTIFGFWCNLQPPFLAANRYMDEALTTYFNHVYKVNKKSCVSKFFDNEQAYIIHTFCRFSDCEALGQAMLVSRMLTSLPNRCHFT